MSSRGSGRVTPQSTYLLSGHPGTKSRKEKWFWLLLIAWLTSVWLVAWRFSYYLPPRWIVARWQADFSVVDSDVAKQRLAAALSLGEPGIRFLVNAMVDLRLEVRLAAQTLLANEVDRWKRLPLEDAAKRVEWIIDELSRTADRLSPDQYNLVESWVVECLGWPLDPKVVDSLTILDGCEQLLSKLSRLKRQARPSALEQRIARATAALDQQPPSGGLPPDRSPEPSSPAQDDARALVSARASLTDDPRLEMSFTNSVRESPAGAHGSVTRNTHTSEQRPFLANRSLSAGTVPFAAPLEPIRAAPLAPQSQSRAENIAPVVPSTRSSAPSDWELARKLGSASADESLAAVEQLRQRGYSGRAIALLERLVDPDPSERMAAVEELPSLVELSVETWLVAMLADPHPAVRQRVVAILGSQPTRTIRERLVRMRDEEQDPIVRRAIEQSLR